MTPFATIHRIYQQARADVRRARGNNQSTYAHGNPERAEYQAFLRRVSKEFHRRLKAAGVEVEGAPRV